MDPRHHQGYFAESYVRVLAAAAGLTATRPELDIAGVDLMIGYQGRRGRIRHPAIEVQVKSWSRPRADWQDGRWKYRMTTRHFNDLAGGDFALPRFLALVIVPGDPGDYAAIGKDHFELRHHAYWISLAEHELVDPAARATVAVDVPLANTLTPQTLLALVGGEMPGKVHS